MTLGETIRLLRTQLELTQPELADKAGIEQSYLSKLENDKGTPSFDIIGRIAQALNLNGMELVHKLSHSYIQDNLSHLPEIAAEYASVKQKREVQMTRRLLAAAFMLLAGLAMALAGYQALLDSNERFFYESQGVLLPDEHYEQLFDGPISDIGETNEEFEQRLLANRGRINLAHLTSDSNLGPSFIRELPDSKRRYFIQVDHNQIRSKLNLSAEILGVVCMVAGMLVGAWAIWRGRAR
jgi:transcriptional regulator with XRE-family HTH domain